MDWKVSPHPPYSPDIALSVYHLFRAIQNDLSSQNSKSFEDIEKSIDEWIAPKSNDFYWRGIHLLRERWAKFLKDNILNKI